MTPALKKNDAQALGFPDLARKIRVLIEELGTTSTGVSKNDIMSLVGILEAKIPPILQKPKLKLDPPVIPPEPPLVVPPYSPSALYDRVNLNYQMSIQKLEDEIKRKGGKQKLLKAKVSNLKIAREKRLKEIKISELAPDTSWLWIMQMTAHQEWESTKSRLIREYQARKSKLERQLALSVRVWKSKNDILNGERSRQVRICENLRRDCEELFNPSMLSKIAKLPWTLLPPSQTGEQRVLGLVREFQNRNPELRIDETRLSFAYQLAPEQIFVGQDEFDGYFAFVFQNGARVLLDNPIEGNAAYIFDENWRALSKLTKTDLLAVRGSHVRRVIHKFGWQYYIKLALSKI